MAKRRRNHAHDGPTSPDQLFPHVNYTEIPGFPKVIYPKGWTPRQPPVFVRLVFIGILALIALATLSSFIGIVLTGR